MLNVLQAVDMRADGVGGPLVEISAEKILQAQPRMVSVGERELLNCWMSTMNGTMRKKVCS